MFREYVVSTRSMVSPPGLTLHTTIADFPTGEQRVLNILRTLVHEKYRYYVVSSNETVSRVGHYREYKAGCLDWRASWPSLGCKHGGSRKLTPCSMLAGRCQAVGILIVAVCTADLRRLHYFLLRKCRML